MNGRGEATERSATGRTRNLDQRNGLILLRDDGWNKVRAGITTISEIVRATKG